MLRILMDGPDDISGYSRLSPRTPSSLRDATISHMDEFAAIGLRTLVLAYRDIEEGYFQDWLVSPLLLSNSNSDFTTFLHSTDSAPVIAQSIVDSYFLSWLLFALNKVFERRQKEAALDLNNREQRLDQVYDEMESGTFFRIYSKLLQIRKIVCKKISE